MSEVLEVVNLGPQPGPQTMFNSSEADIAIYGGAAGGGKTVGLLLDPLRNIDVPGFGGIIFRQTSVQIRNVGALWDESNKIYPYMNGYPREFALEWKFPFGSSMNFGHIEYDKDVYKFQGSQFAWMGWDELTHFSEFQFFYMMSRCRTTCGVTPRIRATCNPDPDSWVRKFIDWWIGEDGFAIPSRSGVLRWFIRINDTMVWADSKEEIYKVYGRGPEIIPRSVTFIAAKLDDNRILMEKDPAYLGNLLALSKVDRMRLKDGNWNIRASAGLIFRTEWFEMLDAVPSGWIQATRFWDRAATKPHEGNKDPDWTRGLLMYKYPNGTFLVGDLKSIRGTPGEVEKLIKSVASHDSTSIKIKAQQDPGSAGVGEAQNFTRMLAGYFVETETMSKDKLTRAKPVSAQSEAGNIFVLRASWNNDFFAELENFPDGSHDDIVDTLSGAFNDLCGGNSILDVL